MEEDGSVEYLSMSKTSSVPISNSLRCRSPSPFVLDQLQVMRRQEKAPAYSRKDYLHSDLLLSLKTNLQFEKANPIDANCRMKMIQWAFEVIDFVHYQRETVFIATNFLDRYFSSSDPLAQRALMDRKDYQLASISALYLAIKLNEQTDIDSSVFAALSRGSYSVEAILRKERHILKVLNWRLCCPSSPSFLCQFMNLLPSSVRYYPWLMNKIEELSNFQLDLSLSDYYFSTRNPSLIAIASLLNAMQYHGEHFNRRKECTLFKKSIVNAVQIDCHSIEMRETRAKLADLLKTNGVILQEDTTRFSSKYRAGSPTCISSLFRMASRS
jgi:hypothetical protein